MNIPVPSKPIPYGRHDITEDDVRSVVDVLKSDFLTQGPTVEKFEQAFSDYIGVKHSLAVSNGTAALHLAVLALGLKPGQKVITTPITFVASANCVLYAGGQVDFVDIDPKTFLMDLDLLEKKLSNAKPQEYAGIIPVDLTGLAVNTQRLRQIADKYGVWILEDACHAPGGSFLDSSAQTIKCGDGVYVDAAIFSFHPVKHIATAEGGMITTNRADIKSKIEILRTHGITRKPELLHENHGGWYYEMQELGYNYRLTDMQCALGLSQLKMADVRLARRRQIAKRYDEAFENVDVISRQDVSLSNRDDHHAYHLYVIQVPERKAVYDHLRANQIFAQVHYAPVHTMPYYQNLGWKLGDFPLAEAYYQKCLSLPMYPTLSNDEQDFVIEKILQAVKR